jgi:TPR repeat protein
MRAFLRASLVGLALLLAAPAVGQDFQKGWAAAQRGNYATALREWRPLAEQGDAGAQYNLGVMYENGQGVPQDHAEAVKW